ncbi:MAG: alpha/beta hydrolase [Deltaproteobacteria bacterium]|nr:alpha/beta hydrolase [Deltaproteobacteria bacterium]
MTLYSAIDQSPLVDFLFYPRRDFTPAPRGTFDLFSPVDEGISVHLRFYPHDKTSPWILFFHGNGEVVSDYDDIAPLYDQIGVNLAVADYRGYGASGGRPTFTHLVHDAHLLFRAIKKELSQKSLSGELWIMGRSMGSISALELGYHYADKIHGLIIESGFASVTRLIKHLGLPSAGIDLEPIEKERLTMIRKITRPSLIIHGEFDSLIPLKEARDLFDCLGATEKELIIIPRADHNNVMFLDLKLYLSAIQKFIKNT